MEAENQSWQAWYDTMPGNPPTLHVTGEINASDTIGSAELVFDSILKREPPILVLRINEHTIFVPSEDPKVRLHYTEQNGPGRYHSVVVMWKDGQVVEIPASDIQIVS